MSMTLFKGATASSLKSLFTNIISGNQISIQLNNLVAELQNHVLAPYLKTLDEQRLFQGPKPFKSSWAIAKDDALMRQEGIKRVYRKYELDNGLFFILNVLSSMNDKVTVLQKYASKFITKDIAKSDMKYTQLNIIRLLESAEFLVQYARRFLYWTLYKEGQINFPDLPKQPPFQPAIVTWLDDHFVAFCKFLTIWSYPTSDFADRISSIPPIMVPSDIEEENSVNDVYKDKVDPMRLGIVPTILNPVYYARSLMLSYRAWRVSSAKAEAEALANDINCYVAARNGNLTQKEKQVVESMRNRMQRQNAEHKRLEEEFDKIYGL